MWSTALVTLRTHEKQIEQRKKRTSRIRTGGKMEWDGTGRKQNPEQGWRVDNETRWDRAKQI